MRHGGGGGVVAATPPSPSPNAQVNVLRDTKPKVARVGKVAHLELVLLHLQPPLQQVHRLLPPHRHPRGDRLVTPDGELPHRVPRPPQVGLLPGERLEHACLGRGGGWVGGWAGCRRRWWEQRRSFPPLPPRTTHRVREPVTRLPRGDVEHQFVHLHLPHQVVGLLLRHDLGWIGGEEGVGWAGGGAGGRRAPRAARSGPLRAREQRACNGAHTNAAQGHTARRSNGTTRARRDAVVFWGPQRWCCLLCVLAEFRRLFLGRGAPKKGTHHGCARLL